MIKCGFCEYSYLDHGVLKCTEFYCKKTKEEILEIARLLGGKKEEQ